jgi:DNA-binding transcriptional LysR family regulator
MSELFSGVVPFVTVAEERSFRRAAERLGVTPAAVSKAITKLEAELGVSLLNRTTRTVSLSREGELFLQSCQEAIAQVRAGRELVLVARRDPRGEVTVSAPHVLGSRLVGVLPRFTARYPGLGVVLRFTDRYEKLVDQNIDVALRVGDLEDSTLVARALLTTRWVTVASPAYLTKHGWPKTLDELSQHNCLRFRSVRGKPVDWTFDVAGERRVAKVSGGVQIDRGELLLDGAVLGLGIAQVMDFMVGDELRRGSVVELLSEHAAQGPTIHGVCLPGQRRSPRVKALLDFLSSELAVKDPARS